MLEQSVRQAILELRRRGQSVRAIGRALQVSRAAVRDVLRRDSAEVPRLGRPEKALEHRDEILRLLRECAGSFTRVHEELTKAGLQLSYPAFTAFCRRHGIGQVPKEPAGRYDFAPGQEMQHDTLPHDVHLGGTVRRVQAASLVLAYSRMLFFQFYPQFHRDRPGEQIERLALHALRGELQGKAVSYLRQGGGKAAARSSLSEARGWLEQALGILDTLPASPSTLEQGFDIRLELRSVLSAFGEVRRAWSGCAKPRPSPSD